ARHEDAAMTLILPLLFLLTAVSGTAVVLVRDPARQIFAIAVNGLVLAAGLKPNGTGPNHVITGSGPTPHLYFCCIVTDPWSGSTAATRGP
ncbi:hypothetical protein, partial [Methylobacterium sp. E-046]|uniref:hypothetical protein n=1 Tax=Methylobacterium sp. E-046 TaxID=2836576 RepID=UPI001FB94998